MPTYNRAWIIARAIESVLSQTFKDFELLIMDDGSTDNTSEVVLGFKDDRIKYHKLEHGGTSVARNKALSLAQGDMIGYLDSDDIYYPEFLGVMVSELQQSLLIVYCGQNLFLVSGKQLDTKVIARKIRNVEYNPVKLTQTNYIGINAILHRKEVIDLIGNFDESLPTLEDWDMWGRLAAKHPFKIKNVEQILSATFYWLKDTAESTTNSFASDEKIMNYFGMRATTTGDTKIVLDKITKELERK